MEDVEYLRRKLDSSSIDGDVSKRCSRGDKTEYCDDQRRDRCTRNRQSWYVQENSEKTHQESCLLKDKLTNKQRKQIALPVRDGSVNSESFTFSNQEKPAHVSSPASHHERQRHSGMTREVGSGRDVHLGISPVNSRRLDQVRDGVCIGGGDSYTGDSAGNTDSTSQGENVYSEIDSVRSLSIKMHPRTRRNLTLEHTPTDKLHWESSNSAEKLTKPREKMNKKSKKSKRKNSGFFKQLDKCPRLSDLACVPWSEQDVLAVLREGRTSHLSDVITVEMMQCLTHLLQRPLVRIAREARCLSNPLQRCTRHTIHSASNIVLSRVLHNSCVQAGMKALMLYGMSGNSLKESKSNHGGLKFSVGRFHRWMLGVGVSERVEESAAVFLTAVMESLLEEVVLLALDHVPHGSGALCLSDLEEGIGSNVELWGLLSPYAHLISARDVTGRVSLPRQPPHPHDPCSSPGCDEPLSADSSLSAASSGFSSGGSFSSGSLSVGEAGTTSRRGGRLLSDGLLSTMSVTSVDSVTELSCSVTEIMQAVHWSCGCHGNTSTHPPITWSTEALHVLAHFLQSTKPTNQNSALSPDRLSKIQAPLGEWVRVSVAHTQHHYRHLVDADDVHQAARLLLPSVEHPPRPFCERRSEGVMLGTDAADCITHVQTDMAFSLLHTGRSDLLSHALPLLGSAGLDATNSQGLTALMCACLRGDEAMVYMLLNAGANPNIQVGCGGTPAIKHWSALTFTALRGHMGITELLLEHGAHVEGSSEITDPHPCPTPLQLAASAGHYELVNLLLSHRADPYLTSAASCSPSFASCRGGHSAMTLAAMHGHRHVLWQLISHESDSVSRSLTLEEMLAEGATDSLHHGTTDLEYRKTHHSHKFPPSASQSFRSNHSNSSTNHSQYDTDDDVNESHIYMTIDELLLDSTLDSGVDNLTTSRHKRQTSSVSVTSSHTPKLSKTQSRAYQECMYHACENGFLDIALELRSLGVQWSLHCWSQCLWAAHSLARKNVVNILLRDFLVAGRHDDINEQFVAGCLPLMFDIFKVSKNEAMCYQLATILSSLYGSELLPLNNIVGPKHLAKIDSIYVNNPELSDVRFVVEGRTLFAHKLLLLRVSTAMQALVEEGGEEGVVTVHDVKYDTFEMMMAFLYRGTLADEYIDSTQLMELMRLSHLYEIDSLHTYIQVLCSERLTLQNCVQIYTNAKVYNADSLLRYCEGFILQNLTSVLQDHDEARKLLFSSKMAKFDLINGLLATLSEKLHHRLNNQGRNCTLV